MNWNISISKSEDLAVVKTSGILNFEQIKQMTKEAFNAATDNGIRKVLGDHRDLDLQVSVLDIYNLPRELLKEGVNPPAKIAVVYSETSIKKIDFEFFEITAVNAGMQVQSFTNLEEARVWLKE